MYFCFFFLVDIHQSYFFIRFCIIFFFFLVTMLKKISRAAIACVVAAAKHLRKTTHPIESESKTTETGILLTSSFSLLFLLVWLNQFFFSSLFFPHLCFFSVEVKGKRSTIKRILYGENYAETKNTRGICFFFVA